MAVKKVRLYNFRNFSDASFNFKSGINFLYGENGVGKTNILEAINYAAIFRSLNSIAKNRLIKDDEKYSLIQINTDNEKIDIEIRTDGLAEQRRVNGKNVSSKVIRERIFSTIYTPLIIKIIYSSAEFTRSFFDKSIQNIKDDIISVYSDYKNALMQRARILKTFDFSKSGSDEVFEKYTTILINKGSEIVFYRISFIERIIPLLNEIYSFLVFGKKENKKLLDIKYISRYSDEKMNKSQIAANMKECLQNVKTQELATGLNLIGPHRDKFAFFCNDSKTKEFVKIEERFSTGQIQVFCLSLVLAIAKIRTNSLDDFDNKTSVLLLDDVLSGLDKKIINNLFALLDNYSQTFITSPSAFDKSNFRTPGDLYEIPIK